jgi:uncharacterized cupredoxin-like copper-binding protein
MPTGGGRARRGGRSLALAALGVTLAALAGCGGAASGTRDRPRTVVVSIEHSSFQPAEIAVRPGETVRFVIESGDPIDHEFILGDEEVQRIHEEGTEAHHGAKPGEVSVPAGGTVETTYTFDDGSGSLIFGCHLPGHYAYGMRGVVVID